MAIVDKVEDKKKELIESITVALLQVRNHHGTRIAIPNPMHYATYIANDVVAAKATMRAPSS